MVHNQKSTCFMLPWLQLYYPDLSAQGFETTYLGASYLEENNYGKYLILEFKEENEYSKALQKHKYYHSTYNLDIGKTHVIFLFTDEAQQGISGKFILGRYSEIDRQYVNSHFKSSQYLMKEEDNVNYQILTKDPRLKAYWEYRLSIPEFNRYITLSDDVEVWSKPEKAQEYYGHESESICEFPKIPAYI